MWAILLDKGYGVHGLIRWQNNPKEDLIRNALPGFNLINGDLADTASLFRALDASAPDEVYILNDFKRLGSPAFIEITLGVNGQKQFLLVDCCCGTTKSDENCLPISFERNIVGHRICRTRWSR